MYKLEVELIFGHLVVAGKERIYDFFVVTTIVMKGMRVYV